MLILMFLVNLDVNQEPAMFNKKILFLFRSVVFVCLFFSSNDQYFNTFICGFCLCISYLNIPNHLHVCLVLFFKERRSIGENGCYELFLGGKKKKTGPVIDIHLFFIVFI